MKYTKDNINGVTFYSTHNKYRVVYPGLGKSECDLYWFSDNKVHSWSSIDDFNLFVKNGTFTNVQDPEPSQLYSIY
jgi:hypothetical protein